jgi:hypothetical protein
MKHLNRFNENKATLGSKIGEDYISGFLADRPEIEVLFNKHFNGDDINNYTQKIPWKKSPGIELSFGLNTPTYKLNNFGDEFDELSKEKGWNSQWDADEDGIYTLFIYESSDTDMNESSSFIILLAAWFLYDTLSKIPKSQWAQYIMENTKEMFADFVEFLSKYGYPVDVDVLRGKIDNIFRLALGKLYKEGGIIDYKTGELNESLPRQRTVDQLKALRKMTKGTDIGDRISDLTKQGANIQYAQNPLDSGIESYEDFERHNKKFVPSWNLKHLMSPFRGESKSKKKK